MNRTKLFLRIASLLLAIAFPALVSAQDYKPKVEKPENGGQAVVKVEDNFTTISVGGQRATGQVAVNFEGRTKLSRVFGWQFQFDATAGTLEILTNNFSKVSITIENSVITDMEDETDDIFLYYLGAGFQFYRLTKGSVLPGKNFGLMLVTNPYRLSLSGLKITNKANLGGLTSTATIYNVRSIELPPGSQLDAPEGTDPQN